jgi:hypothetical protein
MPSDRPDATPALAARYFDGQSSRLYHVTLSVRDGVAVLAGDIARSCPLGQLHVSERSSHAVRKVSFPDGAYLEIADQAAFNALLHDTGHRDGWVVRLQQSWRGALLATAATVLALWLSYQYLLPVVAKGVAYAIPSPSSASWARACSTSSMATCLRQVNSMRPASKPCAPVSRAWPRPATACPSTASFSARARSARTRLPCRPATSC